MPLSINKIKLIRSLQQKKFRQKYNFFIAEGPKICTELLNSADIDLVDIYALEQWSINHQEDYQKFESKVTIISDKELKKISALKTPNLVVILAKIPDLTVNHSLMKQGAHLFCDAIQDPGNLGTIIRIADWFGISSITLNAGCVDPYHPKTVQSTMGSILRVPIANVKDDYSTFFGSFDHIYGTTVDGDNIYEEQLPRHALYVIGNESKGISDKVKQYCTKYISIPKHSKAKAESLNAAVATGILCSELQRSL